MDKIAKRSVPKPSDRAQEYELFLSLILIGVGRAKRGEILAAEQHIKSYALSFALKLIRAANSTNESADSLNSFRRFERDYPELAGELHRIAVLTSEEAAKELCALVLRELKASEVEKEQYQAIAKRLGWTI
jgi:hypothetical protein